MVDGSSAFPVKISLEGKFIVTWCPLQCCWWLRSVPFGWGCSLAACHGLLWICHQPHSPPAIQQSALCGFSPPSPDQCLTWMAWFLTPLYLTFQQNYLPGWDSWPLTFLFIPFTREPPVPVWCWAGNTEGLVLLWVLTDVDIAFHQLFCKQANGSKWNGWVLWAASGTNLCAGDISAATLKSSVGSATLPGALEMKSWALAPEPWLITPYWENQRLLSISGGISDALVNKSFFTQQYLKVQHSWDKPDVIVASIQQDLHIQPLSSRDKLRELCPQEQCRGRVGGVCDKEPCARPEHQGPARGKWDAREMEWLFWLLQCRDSLLAS